MNHNPPQETLFTIRVSKMGYNQGDPTVLISKICSYFEVLRLKKYYCPYF